MTGASRGRGPGPGQACHTPGGPRPRPGGPPRPCPCQSVTSASTASTCARQRARRRGSRRRSRRPAARAVRSGRAPRPRARRRRRPSVRRRARGEQVGGQRVEQVGVLAQLGRRCGPAPRPRPGRGRARASGSASPRTRLRSDASAWEPSLVGSCQGARSCAAQAASVSARRRPEQRAAEPSARRRHARERPRARPAGEAQQHGLGLVVERVPEQDGRGTELVGGALERRVPGGPRGRLARGRRPSTRTTDRRRARARGTPRAASSATCAEPACSPWSTTTRLRAPRRRRCAAATNAAPAASASESGPPEQATRTSASGGRSATRGGDRRPHRGHLAGGTAHPCTRRTHARGSAISCGSGRCSGRRPHRVEPVEPDVLAHRPDERRAVAVLRQLGVQAEQPAQHAVDARGPSPPRRAGPRTPCGSCARSAPPAGRPRPSRRPRAPRAGPSPRRPPRTPPAAAADSRSSTPDAVVGTAGDRPRDRLQQLARRAGPAALSAARSVISSARAACAGGRRATAPPRTAARGSARAAPPRAGSRTGRPCSRRSWCSTLGATSSSRPRPSRST